MNRRKGELSRSLPPSVDLASVFDKRFPRLPIVSEAENLLIRLQICSFKVKLWYLICEALDPLIIKF